jgi:hypothetical protein
MRGFGRVASFVICVGGAGVIASGCGKSAGRGKSDPGSPEAGSPSGGNNLGGVAGTGGDSTNHGGSARGGSSGTMSGGIGNGGASGGGGGGDEESGAPGAGGAPENGGTTSSGGSAGSAGAAGAAGSAGVNGGAGAGGAAPLGAPCDIYAAADPPTPCVAAYSMVRALSQAYGGNLYQVKKSTGETKDIPVLTAGGFANAAEQDAFCGTDACTVSVLYDQSGRGNDLTSAPKNCYLGGSSVPSKESDAKRHALTAGGHSVYALETIPGDGYRNNDTSGMPIDAQSQGIYAVVDGTRYGTQCCWDFGNGTRDNCYGVRGSTNALFFGTAFWGTGAGSGPWFMADFEAGVWAGGAGESSAVNPENPSAPYPFAMGVLKTNATNYAIRVGNAESGDLVTAYDGPLPFAGWTMKGGILLGLSSDGTNVSSGTFFEGAITSGRPSDATDALVLSSVQAVRYGK